MTNSVFRSLVFAGVSSTALLMACGAASAQDVDQIEEVVVTATKRSVAVQDVPAAISVLDGESIEKFDLVTFTDMSRLDPSLQFSSNGIGDSRIIIRGIQSGGAATVALYLDESIITGQTFESSVGGAQPDIGLHDIERVEVLKGPQGTLFGASSMSGAIRIITKKPVLDEFSGSVGAGVSGGSDTNELYDLDGVVNIPIIKDKLGVRLVGWYSDGGGYIDSNSSGLSDINDYKIQGGRARALWQPTDKLTLNLTGIYQKIDVDGSQRFESTLGAYHSGSPTLEPYGEDLTLFSVVGDYDLGFGTVTGTSSYFDRNTEFFTDSTPTAAGFGLPGSYSVINAAERSIWSSELRFASNFEGPLQVVTGVAYQDDKNTYENVVSQTGTNTFPDCTTYATCVSGGLANNVVSARNVHSPFSSTAVFAQADYKLAEKLTLTAGLRQFYSKQHNTELTLQSLRFPGNPGSIQAAPVVALDEHVDSDKLSYNVALTYEPADDLTVYARVASGFRQGGINNAAFAANFGITLPAGFDPDEVVNYEIGAKGVLMGGMLRYEAAAYHIDWSDQQVPAVTAGGAFTYTANAGKSEVDGIELEGTFRPIAGLTLTLGGTYTDAKLTEDQPPTGSDESPPGKKGDAMPYVSKWAFTGQVEYDWALQGPWTAFARANVNYRDKAYTYFNADNPYYFPVADYVLADVGVGVQNDGWEIGLLIRNITDETPTISAETTPDGFRISTVRPRTFAISLRSNF